jgi:hypothetical protein
MLPFCAAILGILGRIVTRRRAARRTSEVMASDRFDAKETEAGERGGMGLS